MSALNASSEGRHSELSTSYMRLHARPRCELPNIITNLYTHRYIDTRTHIVRLQMKSNFLSRDVLSLALRDRKSVV